MDFVFGLITTFIAFLQLVYYVRDRPYKICTWVADCRRVSTVLEIKQLGQRFNVVFDRETLQNDMHLCTVRVRSVGNSSIEKARIFVEFSLEARILATTWSSIPQKEFEPINEEPERQRSSQRCFAIALMEPADEVTFSFLLSGKGVSTPNVTARGKGLKFIHESEHKNIYSEINSRLEKTFLSSVFVCIFWSLFIFGPSSFQNVPSLIFYLLIVVALIISIGFLAFRLRVWGGNTRALFQARSTASQPGPDAFQGFANGFQSFAMSLGVFITAIVTALEYWGRHDLVMQALDFIVNKMGKIVNALTH